MIGGAHFRLFIDFDWIIGNAHLIWTEYSNSQKTSEVSEYIYYGFIHVLVKVTFQNIITGILLSFLEGAHFSFVYSG